MFKRLGYSVTIALIAITAGFVVLGVAWDGAASVDCVQCQIPYLLSGGGIGIGLIVVGAGLLLFEAGRRVIGRLEARLDQLSESLQVAGAASSNGSAAGAGEITPAPDAVVIGRSSFHRQDCRLVADKDDLTYASPEDALDKGLTNCRVCDPAGVVAKKK